MSDRYEGALTELTKTVATPLHLGSRDTAAALLAQKFGTKFKGPRPDGNEVEATLATFLQYLLDHERYADAATLLWTPNLFTAEPRSVRMLFDAMFDHVSNMVPGAASMGKCLGAEVGVLRHDGTVVPAKSVTTGDMLMGDDGTARTVMGTCSGEAEMYRVESMSGSWTCTENHQLVLECSHDKKNGNGSISSTYTEGARTVVEVKDWLKWSAQKQRHFRQIKAGVEYPEKVVQYDPYIYGLWLGDGSTDAAALTMMPGPPLTRWKEYFSSQGATLVRNFKKESNKAETWFARFYRGTNPLTEFTRGSKWGGQRRIRPEYMVNTRAVRAAVLAGLLDTDGWVNASGFGLVTKYRGLCDDVVRLARSIGLRATFREVTCTIKSRNFSGQYWRLHLAGDFSAIPTLLKKVTHRCSRSTHREKFSVTSIGRQAYAGFVTDGNNQFLLGDHTVTHNSYDLGAWMYLDWRRDPLFTSVQVIGPSENHLQRNLFTHLVRMHRQAAIPFPAEVMQLGITTDPHERSAGIFGVVIPLGKRSSGRLQGVKISMRPTSHPIFGPTSRLRVMIEEAENVPVGIWEDVTNIISNAGGTGTERFKICAPFNPKDANGPCAQRCEPVDGWQSLDIEESESWDSKRGWHVTRLDAYKSENVLLGTEKFFGLQTKEGLEKLIQNAGGVGTPSYYTMARGWFPVSGIDLAVIPQHLMHEIVGEYIFTSTPEVCAGVDIALEGEDTAICILGRTGRASGHRKPATKDFPKGEVVEYKDRNNLRISKTVIQIDSIFPLPKGDTTRMVASIIDVAKGAHVNGNYLGVDRTGNGAGVHDILLRTYNAGTKGINPSTSPTEKRILEEDKDLPCDEYSLLISELWFAAKKYIEYGFLKISTNVPQDPLFHELTGRRFLLTGAKTKVESKKEYKSRGNRSPDRADALTILIHAVRLNLPGPPSATNTGAPDRQTGSGKQRIGSTDKMEEPL